MQPKHLFFITVTALFCTTQNAMDFDSAIEKTDKLISDIKKRVAQDENRDRVIAQLNERKLDLLDHKYTFKEIEKDLESICDVVHAIKKEKQEAKEFDKKMEEAKDRAHKIEEDYLAEKRAEKKEAIKKKRKKTVKRGTPLSKEDLSKLMEDAKIERSNRI